MTDENDSDLAETVSGSLDRSIDRLDAATLSRLNQARHAALAVKHRNRAGLPWLTAGSLAAIAVAILASRLLMTSPDIRPDNLPIASIADADFIVASEDLEMLENLEFIAWMAAQDNAG